MDQNYQYKPFSEEVTSTSVFGKSNFHLFDFGVGTSDCNSPGKTEKNDKFFVGLTYSADFPIIITGKRLP